jgi:hypothetical protein
MGDIDIVTLREKIQAMDDNLVARAMESMEDRISSALDNAGAEWINAQQMLVCHSKRHVMWMGGDPYSMCQNTINRIKLYVYTLFAADRLQPEQCTDFVPMQANYK